MHTFSEAPSMVRVTLTVSTQAESHTHLVCKQRLGPLQSGHDTSRDVGVSQTSPSHQAESPWSPPFGAGVCRTPVFLWAFGLTVPFF